MKGKAGPDAHFTDDQRGVSREYPTISFDLFYIGKRVSGEALIEVARDTKEKVMCLAVVDSFSRSAQAIPVYNRADARLMGKDICRFINFLGYGTVMLRCDQEPMMLRVQGVTTEILKKMGCRVLIENPLIRDHANNSHVERTVHRLRQMATVLQCAAEERVGLQIPVNHPLMSWSFVHAAWLINRYVTHGEMTPFEITSGRAYKSKICEFAEPVMAWVYVTPGRKGGTKWEPGIFLKKSPSNDMFIIGVNNVIRLTRYIKRLWSDWHMSRLIFTPHLRCFPGWWKSREANYNLEFKENPPNQCCF